MSNERKAGAGFAEAPGSADSAQYCGRWVNKRPSNQDGEITYLVRTPDGHVMEDPGTAARGLSRKRGQGWRRLPNQKGKEAMSGQDFKLGHRQ